MKFRLHILSLFALAVSSHTAFAATATGLHELKIPGPGSRHDDPECTTQASVIAEQFSAASGATVIDVNCQSGPANVHEAIIRYSAPERVNVYNPNANPVVGASPAWPTHEECVAALEVELPVFRRHTGLEPFASWCYVAHASSAGFRDSFRSAIFAINPGVRVVDRKYVSSTSIAALPLDPAGVAGAAADMARRAGADVVWSSIARGFSTWEIASAFYGVNEIYLAAEDLGYLPTQDSCRAETSELNAAWSGRHPVEANFFCMDTGGGTTRTGVFWWSKSISGEAGFTVTKFSGDHADSAGCMAAKEAIVSRLQGAGETVLAATCLHSEKPREKQPLPPLQVTVITKDSGKL